MKYIVGFVICCFVTVSNGNAQLVTEKEFPSSINFNVHTKIVNLTIVPSSTYAAKNENRYTYYQILHSGILHRDIAAYNYSLTLPAYMQGKFCDFEDAINKGKSFRIDFSLR